MSIRIKICGLTSLADARYCAGAGADYLGFVFYESSPRSVSSDVVREIASWVHGPEIVGVFVDERPDVINRIAEEAQLTMVQLHGDESVETCRAIERPVIKAFRVRERDTADSLSGQMARYSDDVTHFLLDTFRSDQPGGTGRTFDWTVAAELARVFPVILSGGLNRHNVRTAIESVRPAGVDVSSGVESSPGVKDFDRLGEFFDAFNEARSIEPAYHLDD
ncbi:MAG: phosphoribosylanthranilate isomerase [Bacteroidota bacterium]